MVTVEALHATLEDERHGGWGYQCVADVVTGVRRERLDKAIVSVANELRLNDELLFHWSNSKNGRWLADAVYGCSESPSRETVRKLMGPRAMRRATEGVEISAESEAILATIDGWPWPAEGKP